MNHLVIIGGGAAGMAAAAYALSKRLSVAVIVEDLGGRAGTRQTIAPAANDEYLVGAEAAAALTRQVAAVQGAIATDRVLKIGPIEGGFAVETHQHGTLTAAALVIATGATPLPLNLPGSKKLVDHGIGYSLTTHTALLSGKRVAVVGTTRRALRGIAEMAHVAQQVLVIAPAEARANPFVQRLLARPNITFYFGAELKQVIGTTQIERIAILPADDELSYMRVDALFADVGLLPNTQIVRGLVALDSGGFIVVDERRATDVPGIYAAGDCTNISAEHTLAAIGDGARAAISAYDHILG